MTTIVLWVSDLRRSAEFYKDLFGADNYYLVEGFASVKGSGNEVLLHLAPEEYRDNVAVGEDNPIKPVFVVSSIDLAREIALNHGCSMKAESVTHSDKVFVDGLDPDGHVIQICC